MKFLQLQCCVCRKTLNDGPLFRQNAKGVPGIWACADDNKIPLDKKVEEITDLIDTFNRKNNDTSLPLARLQ